MKFISYAAWELPRQLYAKAPKQSHKFHIVVDRVVALDVAVAAVAVCAIFRIINALTNAGILRRRHA